MRHSSKPEVSRSAGLLRQCPLVEQGTVFQCRADISIFYCHWYSAHEHWSVCKIITITHAVSNCHTLYGGQNSVVSTAFWQIKKAEFINCPFPPSFPILVMAWPAKMEATQVSQLPAPLDQPQLSFWFWGEILNIESAHCIFSVQKILRNSSADRYV